VKYGADAHRSNLVTPETPPRDAGFAARVRAALSAFEGAKVTEVIIAVNVAIFVAQLAIVRNGNALTEMPFATMIAFGANVAPATIFDTRVETLLTSSFLHFSILHIGFNMVALWQVGPFVERSVGPGRFTPMYLVSGIAGSAASALWWLAYHKPTETRISAGASGAICGVIGAAMILGARTQGWRGPLAQGMARWLGTIFILGLVASFDNAAHAGGALAGAAIASLWRRGVQTSAAARYASVIASALVCMAAAGVVVARDLTDPYATLDENGRYQRTLEALSARRCDEARHGVDATARLAPHETRVETLRDAIERHCPK
jgi:rhomboid protease GluP